MIDFKKMEKVGMELKVMENKKNCLTCKFAHKNFLPFNLIIIIFQEHVLSVLRNNKVFNLLGNKRPKISVCLTT